MKRRVLLPRPRVAVHLRQRRGRAACSAARATSCSAGRSGSSSPPRSAATSRTHYRGAGRDGRGAGLRGLLPGAARRLVRGARLAEPGRAVGLLPRRHRAAGRRGARPPGAPAAGADRRRRLGGVRRARPSPAVEEAAAAAGGRVPSCPVLGDWVIASLVDEDGRLRDVASWHRDPALRGAGRPVRRAPARRADSRPLRSCEALGVRPAPWSCPTSARPSAGRCRPARCSDVFRALAPRTAIALPLQARGRTLGRAEHLPLGRPAAARRRRRRDRAATSPTGSRWPWTTRGSTSSSAGSPRGCSAACSPRRRSPTTPRSSCATSRRWRPPRSAATGTTRSCSRPARRCSSSATSSGTTPRRRRRWASCAGCCAASPTGRASGPAAVLTELDAAIEGLGMGTMATAAIARVEQTPRVSAPPG